MVASGGAGGSGKPSSETTGSATSDKVSKTAAVVLIIDATQNWGFDTMLLKFKCRNIVFFLDVNPFITSINRAV